MTAVLLGETPMPRISFHQYVWIHLFGGFNHCALKMCNIVNPWKRDKSDPAEIEEPPGNKQRALQKQTMGRCRSLTPEAVQGRAHIDVQTGNTSSWTTSPHLHLWWIKFTLVKSNLFLFRALSGGIEQCHRDFKHWLSNWCFPGQTSKPTLHPCKNRQRCWNADRGGGGRGSKQELLICCYLQTRLDKIKANNFCNLSSYLNF